MVKKIKSVHVPYRCNLSQYFWHMIEWIGVATVRMREKIATYKRLSVVLAADFSAETGWPE